MNFLCIYLGDGKGGALMHNIYLETHIVSLYYRTTWWMFMKLCRDEVLKAHTCVEAFYQIQGRARRSQRASKTKGFLWNAAILVVVSARYSKGWIQGGAKIGRGRASPLTKLSFRSNVHSNILLYCRQHMHLFESRHSGCLYIWLNCLLLVIRWAIKGPWASSHTSN